MASAVRSRRPELFAEPTDHGVVDFGTNPVRHRADRVDERYKFHFKITKGDPQRINFLTLRPLEDYLAFVGTYFADQAEQQQQAEEAKQAQKKIGNHRIIKARK